MISEELKSRLSNALIDGDAEVAEAAAVEALGAGADPLALINDVMIPALTVVGNQFQNGEVFLPELMLAGDAAQQVSKHVEAAIVAQGKTSEPKGVVVIGTVQGDIHDIGKTIFQVALRSYGFTVEDLGVDVPPKVFAERAASWQPDIVGLSGLLSTAYDAMRETVQMLRASADGVSHAPAPIVIGGGLINEHVRTFVGADYWSRDALDGVRLCQRLMAERQRDGS
jgi:5-methyltetrahydrofolate--homocysteine methyltransferase